VNIVQELNAIPVSQVCTEQMIDTSRDSPYTRLTMNIFTAFAEFEREIITERSRDGYEKPMRKASAMDGLTRPVSLNSLCSKHFASALSRMPPGSSRS
jgi:DNA invertase Pin-like site-specific DNA recombinase